MLCVHVVKYAWVLHFQLTNKRNYVYVGNRTQFWHYKNMIIRLLLKPFILVTFPINLVKKRKMFLGC